MCGGSGNGGVGRGVGAGLSPRVRGKHLDLLDVLFTQWSIPACAGEAFSGAGGGNTPQVYPRVCGGSPASRTSAVSGAGLSPRVRGKLIGSADCANHQRSIPACAGEAAAVFVMRHQRRVYPRVCGGSRPIPAATPVPQGLSPRVQGKLRHRLLPPLNRRSIPACAGEAYAASLPSHCGRVYPRVCGGSAGLPGHPRPHRGLSPRVRGKRQRAAASAMMVRSIPACAGEAPPAPALPIPHTVYPRVCGGSRRRHSFTPFG